MNNADHTSVRITMKKIFIDRRVKSGLLWNLLATIAGRSTALFISVILSRVLGKEGFGEFSIIQSTILTFGVFAGFGTGLTTTKHIAETFRTDPAKAGRILGMASIISIAFGGFMTVMLLLASFSIATNFLSSPNLTTFLRIASLSLVPSALNGSQNGALAGFEEFRKLSKVNIYSGIVTIVSVTIGVLQNDMSGALWGYNVAALISCILGARMLKVTIRENGIIRDYQNFLSEWPVLWRFSFPAMLTNTLVTPVNWVCHTMLVNQKDGFSQMAVYNVVTQWRQLLLFLPSIAAQVFLPIIASQSASESLHSIRQHYLKMNVAITLPFFITLSILSPFIMSLYGKSYIIHWPVFVIVQLATLAQIIQSPMITSWAANGLMWTNFTANIVWSSSLIIFSWLLISMGALGLALALFISFLLYFPIILAANWRKF